MSGPGIGVGAIRRPRSAGAAFRFALLPFLLLAGCEADTLYQADGEDGEGPEGPGTALTPLSVSVDLVADDRMELTDSVRVTVSVDRASSSRGIARVGATLLAMDPSGADTVVFSDSEAFDPPLTSSTSRSFRFAVGPVDALSLPDTVVYEAFGFAVDSEGQCVASVSTGAQRLACDVFRDDIVAADSSGLSALVVAVAGRTIRLPQSGVIADAVVDPVRQRFYLSNFTRHEVEVLDVPSLSFTPAIEVGSEPWGLAMNLTQDTLYVANSGGTNISFIPTSTLDEDVPRRLQTPNAVLYQVEIRLDELLRTRYLGFFFDFSDRPQFIAQDFTGLILYSTEPTEAAGLGTIRYVDADPDPNSTTDRPEVKLLFLRNSIVPNPDVISIAYVDSVQIFTSAVANDAARVFDHVPGYPNQIISSIVGPLETALADIESKGSDVFWTRGTWDLEQFGLSDTTYVSASGDRRWVAFGEGATAPAGRIMLWDAANRLISNEIEVVDLVNNASERVNGVDLNLDGTLGVARGDDAAYFFTRDLRLQGQFTPPNRGGAGAALHPNQANPPFAYVGTAESTVKVIDTTHYLQRAEIHIRDAIVGPLRAALPFPQDNAGLTCPGDPACVVAKVFGVTDSNGVVVVDIRAADLQ